MEGGAQLSVAHALAARSTRHAVATRSTRHALAARSTRHALAARSTRHALATRSTRHALAAHSTLLSLVTCSMLLALAGCSTILDLQSPALAPDAGVDSPPDARPDAAATTRDCPAAPTGCALFECGVSTSCYYVCEAAVRWDLAQSYCTEVGGLATIDAQAEQDCVTAAAHPTNAAPVWIGYHQPTAANEPSEGWSWAVGTSPYTNWASFEPNDLSGDQDCASMTSGGQWADTLCSYARRFVCELP